MVILKLYFNSDVTVLNLNKFKRTLPFSNIQVESGIDELCDKGMILPFKLQIYFLRYPDHICKIGKTLIFSIYLTFFALSSNHNMLMSTANNF